MEAEAAHFQKTGRAPATSTEKTSGSKRQIADGPGQDDDIEEDIETKRLRVLEETRAIDADSDGSGSESSSSERYIYWADENNVFYLLVPSDEEEEDETAELLRELEKIKRERAEQKEKEVSPPEPTLCKLVLLRCDFRSVRRLLKSKKHERRTLPSAILCSCRTKIQIRNEGLLPVDPLITVHC